MRFVPSLPPVYTGPVSREVKGLVGVRAVRPVRAHGETTVTINPHKPHEIQQAEQHERREHGEEERRKECRRVSHQAVLVEMRSGMDPRRHNLREDDIVEHIDIEV